MSSSERTGNRKTREQRHLKKAPELGYYLIVTDTEKTEANYFNSIRSSIPEILQKNLVIRVVKTRTRSLIDKCLELTAYEAQYRIPWIIFDRDQVVDFDKIIDEAKRKGIEVGWSNPCMEIWLCAYFGAIPPCMGSVKCCSEFAVLYEKKTGQKYSKASMDIYGKLCKYGNEEKAIELAKMKMEQHLRDGKTKPSEMCPASTVYELVQEIKRKLE